MPELPAGVDLVETPTGRRMWRLVDPLGRPVYVQDGLSGDQPDLEGSTVFRVDLCSAMDESLLETAELPSWEAVVAWIEDR